MPSIIVFIALLLILLLPSFLTKKEGELADNPYIWVAVLIVSLIIGLRWDANDDWINYYETISDSVSGNVDLERFEIIPKYLTYAIHRLGLPYYSWFFFMALFQFVFLVLAANNGLKEIFPWMIILFFFSLFFLSMILTRQVAAMTVILYAYTFIPKKKPLPFFILVALAFCFHRTALICIPLYWLVPYIKSDSVLTQILIVTICVLFGGKVVDLIWSLIPMNEAFRYAHYADTSFEFGENTGWGVKIIYLRYYLVILYSNKLKEEYDNDTHIFSVFYGLLFLDACLYNCLKNDLALSRVELYFSVADLVASGYLFHYLIRSRKTIDMMAFIMLSSITVALMCYTASKGTPWHFVWERLSMI